MIGCSRKYIATSALSTNPDFRHRANMAENVPRKMSNLFRLLVFAWLAGTSLERISHSNEQIPDR